MHLQLDLPSFGESVLFSELAAFVRLAEAAGVDQDAAVELLKAASGTDDIPQCLAFVADEPGHVQRSVPIEVSLLSWAVASIDAVTSSDGDARGMLTGLLDLRRDLMDVLLEMDVDDERPGTGTGTTDTARVEKSYGPRPVTGI